MCTDEQPRTSCGCWQTHTESHRRPVCADGQPQTATDILCVLTDTHGRPMCTEQTVHVAHTRRPWLSISAHISTLVLGLSTLALPMDCLGDFGPHGLSVQYTQDVCGCPPAHTGCLWLSVSTHRTSVAVRQHTHGVCGCPCVSVSTHRTSVAVHQYTYQHAGPFRGLFGTHISTLVLGLSTLTLPVDCLGDFSPRGLSVQYTQDVRGCLPLHTELPWLSVAVCQHTQDVRVCSSAHTGCPCVSVSTHRTSVAVHQYTFQHTGPWTQHAGPSHGVLRVILAHVGCLFSTHRTSVAVHRHTKDVCGCLWLSVSTHMTSVAVHVCPCVFVSTHMTSVAVHQYIYQHAGPWTQHAGPSRGLFGTSVGVRQHTQDVRGCPCVSVSTHRTSVAVHQYTYQHVGPCTQHADTSRGCSGDFGPRGSVPYTQDVPGYLPAHTGVRGLFRTSVAVRVCPSVSISTHMTSVAVHQYTYQHDVRGCPPAHTGRLWLSVSTHWTSVAVCVCPWVSASTHRTSVDFHRYPSAHTGRPCVSVSTHRMSVCVRVCPLAHTGRPWLSISTHISTLVVGLSTLALPVDCLGDFGPCGLSVQYTQDVRGCPPAHPGRP
ncbi:hypothetical protein YC2023_071945 [Brassica napus]